MFYFVTVVILRYTRVNVRCPQIGGVRRVRTHKMIIIRQIYVAVYFSWFAEIAK